MTKKTQHSVETPIGFAEGKVVRIEKLSTRVLIVVEAWNEKTIEVEFDGVIGVREAMSFELSDLVVTENAGEFAKWCIGRAYESGHDGGESLFQFLDVDGLPSIEVVAKGVQIRAT